MIIRTRNNVNIRKGTPSTKAEVIGVILAGKDITVEGLIENGEPINGNSRWYFDRQNNYYWSGAIETGNVVGPSIQLNNLSNQWWFTKYGIDKIWAHTRGENAKVVILDTGIDATHPDLKDAFSSGSNFIAGATPTDVSDNDSDSHGTRCSGIIAARGFSKAIGVAPACHLHVGKILSDGNGGGFSFQGLVDALTWAQDVVKADVISISLGVPDDPSVKHKIDSMKAGDKVIICAAVGNGGGPDIINTYPASYSDCLSIGAVNEFSEVLNISNKSDFIDIVSPGGGIITTSRNDTTFAASDTSIATAYTAGVAALLASFCKKKNIPLSRVQRMLTATARDVGDADWDVASGFGIIDPLRAFSKLFNIPL